MKKATPGLRLELLNCTSQIAREEYAAALASGEVSMDISMVEGVAGLARLVRQAPLARVLFGSYYPFFYFQSATLKMKESGLAEASQTAICVENARRLISPKGTL